MRKLTLAHLQKRWDHYGEIYLRTVPATRPAKLRSRDPIEVRVGARATLDWNRLQLARGFMVPVGPRRFVVR